MGAITQGILGGFSGKVGTVAGSSWNSISYMRSLADGYTDPKTEKQVCQRGRFAEVVRFLRTMVPYLRLGYKEHPAGQSAYSSAMSYVLKNAVEGCGADAAVDFQKAMISRGSLVVPGDASVEAAAGKLTFTWTDNSGNGNADADDVAMVLAYNKVKAEAVYDLEAGARADGTAELTLPGSWGDEALAVYLSFRSAQGKSVSNSLCLQDDEVASSPGDGSDGEDGADDDSGQGTFG